MSDEESLVRRAQGRDAEALAELYERYFDRIYGYIAVRVRDQKEAEDLAEQVFLKVMESICSFQWRGVPFSAWLFRIARNLVIDYVRKMEQRRALSLDETTVRGEFDPAAWLEEKATFEQLGEALGRLTRAQREVISMRFAGGLSTDQVAQVMGKSPGAVKALQHSALVSLRKSLGQRGER